MLLVVLTICQAPYFHCGTQRHRPTDRPTDRQTDTHTHKHANRMNSHEIHSTFDALESCSPLCELLTSSNNCRKRVQNQSKAEMSEKRPNLRGAWSDRDTNDIFAHCSLIFYFLDFKFSNFVCPAELHPLIWFFFKNSFRKKKNIRKTTQNALAPSVFIVLSIVLKLGRPLLHTQAPNRLLQNF